MVVKTSLVEIFKIASSRVLWRSRGFSQRHPFGVDFILRAPQREVVKA
jgi:hypothetical protein